MPHMTTRREFLTDTAQMAFALGSLNSALSRFSILNPPRSSEDEIGARAAMIADDISLGNDSIAAVWTIADGVFRPVRLTDGVNRSALPVSAQAFTLALADKTTDCGE